MTKAVLVMAMMLGAVVLGCDASPAGPGTTLGDVCSGVAQPFCSRVVACSTGAFVVYEECAATFMGACCDDAATCDQKLIGVIDEAREACVEGVRYLSCDRVANGELPATCALP